MNKYAFYKGYIEKVGGTIRGVPDGTGPYGRGMGPGGGRADGSGMPGEAADRAIQRLLINPPTEEEASKADISHLSPEQIALMEKYLEQSLQRFENRK